MAKLKAPVWDGDYDKFKKLLLIWLRTIDINSTDSDIVSVVILGLNKASEANNRACDLILDMDEEQLYPDMSTLAGVSDTAPASERTEAIARYREDQLRDHPEKKVIVDNVPRIIPGLNVILAALHEKFGVKKEEKMFQDYV
jgi:hypothetical protein